ncbi:MAG: hypothetical protein WD851_07055 [Pirellulales bacterium]
MRITRADLGHTFARTVLAWGLLSPMFAGAEELRTTGETASTSSTPAKPQAERVDQLIAQLGSTRYVDRRAAEQELLAIGLEAFDQVLAGTKHLDPEIAASCEYLLGELTVRWDRRDDPPQVRRWLQSYGTYSEEDRRQVLRGLAAVPHGEGSAALCRICRYDMSEEISRAAALLVLRPDKLYPALPPDAAVIMAGEIGESPRPGALWIRLFAQQLRDGAQAIPAWRDAIDRSTADSQSVDTDSTQQTDLLWNLLRLELTAGRDEPVENTVARLVEARPESASQYLTRVVDWIAEAENWPALERVLGQFQEQLTASKRGAYAIALARHAEGREDLAEQAAETALGQPANLQRTLNGLDERVILGKQLLDRGFVDWGRRELQATVEEQPIISQTGVVGRWVLFESLFDREEYDHAAELLAKLNTAMSETAQSRNQYKELLQAAEDFIPAKETLRSREAFARALVARKQGNGADELKHLQAAIAVDPTDADVIIAMYRSRDLTPELREKTLKLIDGLSRTFQQQIEENPDEPTNYNQWAWLISNTIGDYQKAIRYSQRSLQLQPEDAGYLDTLGRCYFAAGDLERAVKTQRQAVAKMPHMQVMQRQLEQFEQTLAAKSGQQAAGSGQ